jgi:hypothetical protein
MVCATASWNHSTTPSPWLDPCMPRGAIVDTMDIVQTRGVSDFRIVTYTFMTPLTLQRGMTNVQRWCVRAKSGVQRTRLRPASTSSTGLARPSCHVAERSCAPWRGTVLPIPSWSGSASCLSSLPSRYGSGLCTPRPSVPARSGCAAGSWLSTESARGEYGRCESGDASAG